MGRERHYNRHPERLRRAEGGFTFIELIVSLAILATSMTVFIGLQAAAVQRTIRDQNVQQAMLAARRLMAAIDTNPKILEQGNIPATPLSGLLSQLGLPMSTNQAEVAALEQLQAELTVEVWPLPIPDVEQNPLQKVTLTVAWGTAPGERFVLVYYVPTDDAQNNT